MKPKNDGQVLTVRLSAQAHADLAYILMRMAEDQVPPSQRTKTQAVERALAAYKVLSLTTLASGTGEQ